MYFLFSVVLLFPLVVDGDLSCFLGGGWGGVTSAILGKNQKVGKSCFLAWKIQMELLCFEVLYFCHHVINMQHKWTWLKNGLCVLVLITAQPEWQVTSPRSPVGQLFTDLNDCNEQNWFYFKTEAVSYGSEITISSGCWFSKAYWLIGILFGGFFHFRT